MKPKLLSWMSVGLMLSGCGKHPSPSQSETPVPNPATAVTAQNLPKPAGPPTVVTVNPADPAAAADLSALSRSLRGWIVGHRRLPNSFEEFVSSANLTVPPPPPGKKYAINKSTVILVDR